MGNAGSRPSYDEAAKQQQQHRTPAASAAYSLNALVGKADTAKGKPSKAASKSQDGDHEGTGKVTSNVKKAEPVKEKGSARSDDNKEGRARHTESPRDDRRRDRDREHDSYYSHYRDRPRERDRRIARYQGYSPGSSDSEYDERDRRRTCRY